MKNLIFLAVLIIGLVGCTTTNEKKNTENIDLVKSYVQAVENLDFESMSNFLDDNYLGMGPSYGDSIGKSDAVENWKWSVVNLYEKIKYDRSRFAAVTIPEGDNKGDWVANWAELTIDYKNGGSVTILANSNYLVENGKIMRSITFYNEADVLRQLGYEMVLQEYNE
ncbi:MAG: ester cyclase [Bacteroidales bacterium]|nr:ester cyclase [Bacteroidales bacterium]